MADNASNGQDGNTAAQPQAQPSLNVLAQYVKDLSFENPGAPQTLQQRGQPEMRFSVNVQAKALSQTDFEVVLDINARAEVDKTVMFVLELAYAGLFRLQNIPQEQMQPIIMIECPRLIFPFARQIIAGATRDGGFPPLMLEPIDFAALYRQRLAELARQQQGAQQQ